MKRFLLLLGFIACLSLIPSRIIAADNDYEPYRREEFPNWVHALRRGEIVAFGIFPLAVFVSSLTYELGRFIFTGFNTQYAPWFFAPADSPGLSNNERIGIVISGAGISIILGVIDYCLGRPDSPLPAAEVPES